MSESRTEQGEGMVSTEPPQVEPSQTLDSLVARRTIGEMSALVRVLFGVNESSDEPPAAELPPMEEPQSIPEHPAPPSLPAPSRSDDLTSVRAIPLAGHAPSVDLDPDLPAEEPRAAVSTSLPFSDIPLADSLPGPAASSTRESSGAPHRRLAGPSPELLEEIAFLEE